MASNKVDLGSLVADKTELMDFWKAREGLMLFLTSPKATQERNFTI